MTPFSGKDNRLQNSASRCWIQEQKGTESVLGNRLQWSGSTGQYRIRGGKGFGHGTGLEGPLKKNDSIRSDVSVTRVWQTAMLETEMISHSHPISSLTRAQSDHSSRESNCDSVQTKKRKKTFLKNFLFRFFCLKKYKVLKYFFLHQTLLGRWVCLHTSAYVAEKK